MIEYIVIEASNMGELCLDVDRASTKGYQPIGGVSVVTFSDTFRDREQRIFLFHQAMVKEDRKLFAEKLKAAQRRGWTLDEVIANTLNETLEEANAEEN